MKFMPISLISGVNEYDSLFNIDLPSKKSFLLTSDTNDTVILFLFPEMVSMRKYASSTIIPLFSSRSFCNPILLRLPSNVYLHILSMFLECLTRCRPNLYNLLVVDLNNQHNPPLPNTLQLEPCLL